MPQPMRSFKIGDVVALGGHGLGEPARLGEILEVLGAPGCEHYRILWDGGRESIFYPAADAGLHLRHSASVPKA